jgi:type VI protein secretion system component VasK
MPPLRLLPASLCLLLLGALGLREGLPFTLVLPGVLLLLGSLMVPLAPVRILLAGLLGCEALLWALVAVARAQVRLTLGEPWLRLVLILSGVALFCAWSGWLLWRGRRREAPKTERPARMAALS